MFRLPAMTPAKRLQPFRRHSPRRTTALVLAAAALACLAVGGRPVNAAHESRPNIILIMSDDMGYSDIGCYGGEIKTPVLDALAASGLRFTQFYNTSRCCPTRASLLTGLYPHQAGVGWMLAQQGLPGYTQGLNRNCLTIAEVMRGAGYRTYMTGKWHVTSKVNPRDPADKSNWPLQRGFDRFYGTIHGAGSFYDPNSLTRDNELVAPENPETFFYTDAISDQASRYIREHHAAYPQRPFFMYVTYTAAHWPMHARPHNIAKYQGVYDAGWDAIRAARYQRMKEMRLIDPAWKLTARDPKSPAWEEASDKEWEIRLMEVYAAMVDCMDQGIGRIIAALEETEQREQTVVFFLQDNGGCAEGMGRGNKLSYRDADPQQLKPMRPGELQSEMIPRRTRDGKPIRQGRGVMAGPADTYLGYGLSWANASNTPFKEYKHWVHEGGISTPLIVAWPAGIAEAQRGKFDAQPAHLIDIMATCVDLAEAKYPDTFEGQPITPLEGVSLRPAFRGAAFDRGKPIFWEHEANGAVRDGKWKIVRKGSMRTGQTTPWELYDMERDRTETTDLADTHPEIVQQLAAKWEAWAVHAKVKPWPWGREETGLSPKRRFVLAAGAALPKQRAPNTTGKALRIEAEITAPGDGVIVAQGGVSQGYSLYVADGQLRFATRHRGKLSTLNCESTLPARPVTVLVTLDKEGAVKLSLEGREVGRMQTPGTVPLPVDGLNVGRDGNDAVGNYPRGFPFQGKIKQVTIELND